MRRCCARSFSQNNSILMYSTPTYSCVLYMHTSTCTPPPPTLSGLISTLMLFTSLAQWKAISNVVTLLRATTAKKMMPGLFFTIPKRCCPYSWIFLHCVPVLLFFFSSPGPALHLVCVVIVSVCSFYIPVIHGSNPQSVSFSFMVTQGYWKDIDAILILPVGKIKKTKTCVLMDPV